MKTPQDALGSPFPGVAGIVGSSPASSPAPSGHSQQGFPVFSYLAGGSLLSTKSVPPNGFQLCCDYLFIYLFFSVWKVILKHFLSTVLWFEWKKKKLIFLDSVNGRRFNNFSKWLFQN